MLISSFKKLFLITSKFSLTNLIISFWAKAGSGTPKIGIELAQEFGSGGSPSADVTNIGSQSVTISTSWTRYSLTVSVPSISGKTIGTTANTSSLRLNLWLSAGTDFATRAGTPGLQNETFDVWGVQVEAGNTATAFQTATGTLAGELAACQRYYYMHANALNDPIAYGGNYSATVANCYVKFPVSMRTAPTLSATSGTNYYCKKFVSIMRVRVVMLKSQYLLALTHYHQ